jgi:hypothetical protein
MRLHHHIAAAMLVTWTMAINQPRATPEVQKGFPTKVACEQAAAKWKAKFETEVMEGTNRTIERRRRLARAVPSIKCVESPEIPSAHP